MGHRENVPVWTAAATYGSAFGVPRLGRTGDDSAEREDASELLLAVGRRCGPLGTQVGPMVARVDIAYYPANLCRLCCHVLNEARRLADETLSHEKCPNARGMPEGPPMLLGN